MGKHAGGRPRKVMPEDLARAVDDMIAAYNETGDITQLHDYRLLDMLKISPRTLDKYYDGEADKALYDNNQDNNTENINGDIYTKGSYCDAIKKLVAFRQMSCVQHMTGDRTNTGWIFLAKQARFGGFQDVQRQEIRGNQTFTVNIAGPDGKAIKSE